MTETKHLPPPYADVLAEAVRLREDAARLRRSLGAVVSRLTAVRTTTQREVREARELLRHARGPAHAAARGDREPDAGDGVAPASRGEPGDEGVVPSHERPPA